MEFSFTLPPFLLRSIIKKRKKKKRKREKSESNICCQPVNNQAADQIQEIPKHGFLFYLFDFEVEKKKLNQDIYFHK